MCPFHYCSSVLPKSTQFNCQFKRQQNKRGRMANWPLLQATKAKSAQQPVLPDGIRGYQIGILGGSTVSNFFLRILVSNGTRFGILQGLARENFYHKKYKFYCNQIFQIDVCLNFFILEPAAFFLT